MPTRRYAVLRSALIVLCLFFVFSTSCKTSGNGPGDGNTANFTQDQLQADFAQMRNTLESNPRMGGPARGPARRGGVAFFADPV